MSWAHINNSPELKAKQIEAVKARWRVDPFERWWPRVQIGPGDCWLWIGSQNGLGYGRLWCPRKRKMKYAHRWAWEFFRGLVPDGLCVLHKCDNPPCVNPAHLFLGTHADNMRDCVRKGRGRWKARNNE